MLTSSLEIDGQTRLLVLGLSPAEVDGLLAGRAVKLRLASFGVSGVQSERLYALLADTPEIARWREARMVPPAFARVDCLSLAHVGELRHDGASRKLPRGGGFEVLLVGGDSAEVVRRAVEASCVPT